MAGYVHSMAGGARSSVAGDLWGGSAAMLVAVPSAIAFGVTIFAPLGAGFAAEGALAGVLGAAALGLFASGLGGSPRLISAPCAPAAALLSAFALHAAASGATPESLLITLALIGLVCGLLQVAFGVLGIGRLIKYMPYPVVSGYMTGVGLIIVASQVPKLLGVANGTLWQSLGAPALWSAPALFVGVITIATMVLAPRLTKRVPGPVLGIAAGMCAYFLYGMFERSLLTIEDNPLVVGALPVSAAGLVKLTMSHWQSISHISVTTLRDVLVPGATLAVLLSIDTLKTCVVTDALTRSRHDSNRELIGQGCGNAVASLLGGAPGAGTMGATMVNIAGGGTTRRSGMTEGALSLAALLALAPLMAWIPIAALAGILIVIGVRMVDWDCFHLARARSTLLDFLVIAAVVVVAETIGLIAASAVGTGLAAMLFIREQTRASVVHRKSHVSHMRSKQVRLPDEMAILARRGEEAVIFELQGSLFFGTTDQLYGALEPHLDTCSFVILDMRRVQSVDVTAAHVLERIEDALNERKAYFLFSHLPLHVPSGQDMGRYFDQVGLVRPERRAQIFNHLDEALEWVENRILDEARVERAPERPLELEEIELFRGRKAETLAALAACMETRSFAAGETIFRRGEPGETLFLIRRGRVRALLPIAEGQTHHLATFGRGDFFGEMTFLDREARSADAVAATPTELFVLSRTRFDALATEHRALALNLLEGLARTLSVRLRYSNAEVRMLQAS
jgi:sulfate permease, SulP family